MDLDIDVNLDSDRIGQFLKSKLEEIQIANVELEKCLQTRNDIVKQCLQEFNSESNHPEIALEEYFKKIHENKYVLAYKISNKNNLHLEVKNVIVNWNSSQNLMYKSFIVSIEESDVGALSLPRGLNYETGVDGDAILVVVLPYPLFEDKLIYKLTGLVIFEADAKKYHQKMFKNLELRPNDAFDKNLYLDGFQDNLENLLIHAFTCDKFEFLAFFPEESDISLETVITMLFPFEKTVNSPKPVFFSKNLSRDFDGSVLQVTEDFITETDLKIAKLDVYTKNEASLFIFLHSFYKQTSDIYLLPPCMYKDDFSKTLLRKDVIGEFKKAVLEEIDDLTSQTPIDRLKHLKFELKSDILFAKIKKSN